MGRFGCQNVLLRCVVGQWAYTGGSSTRIPNIHFSKCFVKDSLGVT